MGHWEILTSVPYLTARNADDITVSTATPPGLPNVGPKMSHIFLPNSTRGAFVFGGRVCRRAEGSGEGRLRSRHARVQTFVPASSRHVQDN